MPVELLLENRIARMDQSRAYAVRSWSSEKAKPAAAPMRLNWASVASGPKAATRRASSSSRRTASINSMADWTVTTFTLLLARGPGR